MGEAVGVGLAVGVGVGVPCEAYCPLSSTTLPTSPSKQTPPGQFVFAKATGGSKSQQLKTQLINFEIRLIQPFFLGDGFISAALKPDRQCLDSSAFHRCTLACPFLQRHLEFRETSRCTSKVVAQTCRTVGLRFPVLPQDHRWENSSSKNRSCRPRTIFGMSKPLACSSRRT